MVIATPMMSIPIDLQLKSNLLTIGAPIGSGAFSQVFIALARPHSNTFKYLLLVSITTSLFVGLGPFHSVISMESKSGSSLNNNR